MFYVYTICSIKRNYIYPGLTDNVERRFHEHQSGNNGTTKPFRPFKIILIEEYGNRSDARKREKFFKSGLGKEYIKREILKH